MNVKVVGPGCKNCSMLLRRTKQAIEKLNIKAEITYVTDITAIAEEGVLSTPALIINDEIVSAGRVLTGAEVERIFRDKL